ncbi:MAG: hypothetical protein JWN57_878, partial [Frankiales bacterium]|nr:hypothetical protein [Frankiales bacterium]
AAALPPTATGDQTRLVCSCPSGHGEAAGAAVRLRVTSKEVSQVRQW